VITATTSFSADWFNAMRELVNAATNPELPRQ
jgi:hypothetical protein